MTHFSSASDAIARLLLRYPPASTNQNQYNNAAGNNNTSRAADARNTRGVLLNRQQNQQNNNTNAAEPAGTGAAARMATAERKSARNEYVSGTSTRSTRTTTKAEAAVTAYQREGSHMRAAFNAGKAAASASHGAVSSRRELEDLLERQRAAECKVKLLSAELTRQRQSAASAELESRTATTVAARLEEEIIRMRNMNQDLASKAREASTIATSWKRRYDELQHMHEMVVWRFHESNRQYGAVSMQMKEDTATARAEVIRERAAVRAERRLRTRAEAGLARERAIRREAERSLGRYVSDDENENRMQYAAAPAPAPESSPAAPTPESHALNNLSSENVPGLANPSSWWMPVAETSLRPTGSNNHVVVALVGDSTSERANPEGRVLRVRNRLRKVRTSAWC